MTRCVRDCTNRLIHEASAVCGAEEGIIPARLVIPSPLPVNRKARLCLKSGTMLVYDPRPPETTRARLAPRLETLVGKRVLLFDNGKLDPQFGWTFPVVFEVLEGTLPRQFGVSSILHRTEYLLPATPERLRQLAEEIDTLAVDAVVFALLDAGVAQPTVALAIELEMRGIPTACICYGPGAQLAAASAAPLIEALSLHTVNVMRTAPQDKMRGEANRLVAEVAEGLTAGEEIIRQWVGAGQGSPAGPLRLRRDPRT